MPFLTRIAVYKMVRKATTIRGIIEEILYYSKKDNGLKPLQHIRMHQELCIISEVNSVVELHALRERTV